VGVEDAGEMAPRAEAQLLKTSEESYRDAAAIPNQPLVAGPRHW
jgi:hypothetical protein